MLYIIITLIVLVAYTYTKYDTISPKLLVRSTATVIGYGIGSAPEIVKTTVTLVKASNAAAELELRTAGSQGPIGFREGTVIGKKVTRETLADISKSAKDLLEESLKELDALKS